MFEVISEDLQCSPPWGWEGRVRMVRDEGKSSRKVAEWYALLILLFRWLSPLSPNGMALVGKIRKVFFSSGLFGRTCLLKTLILIVTRAGISP